MRRLFFVLGVVLLVGGAGCGDKEKTSEETATPATEGGSGSSGLPPSDVISQPGETMGENLLGAPIAGVYLRPAFDPAGATDLTVGVGEEFDICILAETVEPFTTNAAQFRVDVPPGVSVTSVTETPARTISMGTYDKGYMIAFDCQPVGKFVVITFHCVAEEGFRGGPVTTAAGIGGDTPYLGFSTCDFQHAPANTGTATLKQK